MDATSCKVATITDNISEVLQHSLNLSHEEKREICLYKAGHSNISVASVAEHFSFTLEKKYNRSYVSEILVTWLGVDSHEGVTFKCDVSLEQARDGLLKALTYLEAHPDVAFCHIQMLYIVLQYFNECMPKSKQADAPCSRVGKKQSGGWPNANDVDLDHTNDDYSDSEEAVNDKKMDDVNNSVDVILANGDSCGDGDNYHRKAVLGGVLNVYDNGKMSPVVSTNKNMFRLFQTLPENLAVGRSALTSNGLGIVTVVSMTCVQKWGPYKSTDVHVALCKRCHSENEDNFGSPGFWLKYLSSTVDPAEFNVRIDTDNEHVFLVTTKNIPSGTELLLGLMDLEKEKLAILCAQMGEHQLRSQGCSKSSGTVLASYNNNHDAQDSVSSSILIMSNQLEKQQSPVLSDQTSCCPMCGNLFVKSRKEKYHTLEQKHKKPFICPVCGHGFSQAMNLKQCMTLHCDRNLFFGDFSAIMKILPGGLKLMRSTIRGVKWGIFAVSKLEAGVRWGPCISSSHSSSNVSHPTDDTRLLWLQYIQFTDDEDLQNVCVQHENNGIYYIIGRDIPPETELLIGIRETGLISQQKPALKPYRCGKCNKHFSDIDKLTKHQVYCAERPHKCNICHRSFLNIEHLNKHQAIHNKQRLHMCTTCGKGFRTSKDIKRHSRIHTGERPYKCTVCGKGFTQQTSIKRHMVVHTGEKPYICDVCGKEFTDSSHFRRHQKIHFGEKCHICSICGKGFLYADKLRTHVRIHTGEKPYLCTVCGKEFACDSSFSKHKKIHIR